ncbi:MAG: flavin prenyltransferase UbiX [Clostridiales bacterium]|nr:flavin prenyltransferase UbiX [Clostridiales bacterium]
MKKYIIGITGASGSIYGVRLAEEVLKRKNDVFLVITENGERVMEYETGYGLSDVIKRLSETGNINLCGIHDIFAPIASGSFKVDGMAVVPCSMGTMGCLANGISLNLLDRAADVCIKEKRKLVLVPRETPLNTIHIENMLKLSKCGVDIIPAAPGFYNKPESIDDMVNFITGKVLEHLGMENDLYKKWGG